MSDDTQVKQEDKERAHEIMLSGKSRYFDPFLEDVIGSALAAVRREAFKEAAGIARMMAAGETLETGRQKALNIAAALEASANSEKGEVNG